MGIETTENFIQTFFSHHPDGLLVIGRQTGAVRYMNTSARRMLGVVIDIGQQMQYDYPLPDEPGKETRFVCQCTGKPLSVTYLADHRWEEEDCITLSIRELPGPSSWFDENEGSLSLLDILDHSMHGVVLTDENGNINQWNARAAELFGLTSEEVLGQPLWNIQYRFEPLERRTPEAFEQLRMLCNDMLLNGEEQNSRIKFNLMSEGSGNRQRIETLILPIKSKQGYRLASISQDVSRTKRLEESLRASEIRYRTLFNVSPVALWEKDLSKVKAYINRLQSSGIDDIDDYFIQHPEELLHCIDLIRFIEINPTALELYEADNFEELVVWLKSIHHPSYLERIRNEFVALSNGLMFSEGEALQQTLQGKEVYTLAKTSLTPGCEESWAQVFVSVTDITEYRRLEASARDNEARFRNLFEESPIALFEEDLSDVKALLDGIKASGADDLREYFTDHPHILEECFLKIRYSGMNQEAVRLFGAFNMKELALKNPIFLHDSYRQRFLNEVVTLASGNNRFTGEAHHPTLSGKTIYTRMSVIIPAGYEDTWKMAIVSFMDLTDRRRVEEALRISEERYRAVVESQTELILRYNADGIVTFANSALCKFRGLKLDSFLGSKFDFFVYEEDWPVLEKALASLSPEHPMIVVENRNLDADGRLHWFRWTNHRTYDENGNFTEHQSVGHEITERVEAEKKLRRYANRLHVLHNIDQAILNVQEPEKVFRVVLGYMCDLGFNEYASIIVFDLENHSAERIATNHCGDIQLLDEEHRQRTSLPQLPPELLSGSIHIVEDVAKEPHTLEYGRLFADSMTSFLAVPLYLQGQLAGTFNLAFSKARTYDQETLEVAHQVADSLAVAVQNARFQQADRLARQRTQNLRQATSAIGSYLDLSQVLDNILIYLEKVVPYKRASIFLKKDQTVIMVAGQGFTEIEKSIGFEASLNDTLTHRIMSANSAVILDDASTEPSFVGWAGTQDTRAWMGVPLIWRQEVIGYLAMDSLQIAAFSEEEGALAQDFANQAAIAIENARLYEDARRRAREAETLARTATAVSATLDRQQLIQNILEQLEQVVPYDSASVLLLDGNVLEIVGGRGFGEYMKVLQGLRIPLDDNNPDILVYRSRKPFILDDAPQEYEIFRTEPHIHTRSWLGVPLLFQNRFIGTLALDSLKPGFFNEDHARLATGFANQVATAMENVRLFEDASRQTNNLRRRDSILQAVSHTAEAFLRTARWRDTIQNELKNLGRATEANRAFIHENFFGLNNELTVHPRFQWINPHKPSSPKGEMVDDYTYEEVGLSRWRKVFQNNQNICCRIDELPAEERFFFKKLQVHFLMILPIYVQGEWWGTIGFDESSGVREWTTSEVDAIKTAADILGAAIQRERTEDALLASQKLADLGTLAAGVAHELNSPLQVITGSSEGLLKQLKNQEPIEETRLWRNLEMINRSGWRSAEIIRSLLAYTRSSGGEQEKVDFNLLVKDTLLLIEHQLRSWSNITVKTDLAENLPQCRCNRNQITQVLINLMTNARDAMHEGGSIHIQTDYLNESQEIILKVSDSGSGIPDSIRSKIFSPFFTTKPLGQGTGLGLSIVMGIVESHGGQISVDSMEGTGTTFSIRLPIEHNLADSQTLQDDDLQGRYENIL